MVDVCNKNKKKCINFVSVQPSRLSTTKKLIILVDGILKPIKDNESSLLGIDMLREMPRLCQQVDNWKTTIISGHVGGLPL